MVLKWIVWYWYILGFQLCSSKFSIAVELVEENFTSDVQSKPHTYNVDIKSQTTNEDTISGTIVKDPRGRAEDWSDQNVVSANIEESSRFIVSPLTDAKLGIKISLFISDVKSDSIQISWKLHTLRSKTNFGLKVSFRPFGSSIEREIIFLVESNSRISNELNYYEISDLTPNTGYVFCFSIIQGDGVEVVLESDEYEQVTTTRSISTATENSELSTTVPSTTNTIPSTTIQKIPSTTTIKSIPTTITIDEVPTTDDILTPRVANEVSDIETTTLRNFVSSQREIITQRNTPPPMLPKKKGSFVYTSTGELIYLPTSAWNPFRRKRSTDELGSKTKFQSHFQKISTNSDVQCTEIFTSKVNIFGAGNFVILFTAFAIITCVVILLLMICCMNKLLCKTSIIQSLKKLTFGIKNTTRLSTEVDVSSAVTYVRGSSTESRRNSFGESIDVESVAPEGSTKSSSLPSYHEILLRHELREKLKVDTIKQQKGLDIFHPGYAIPPTSTTDAYGYDIPKLSNKQMGPSCSDNTSMDDGFNWNDDNIYNWNCHAPRKKSTYASKNVPRLQDIFPPPEPSSKAQGISDKPVRRLPTDNIDQENSTLDDKKTISTDEALEALAMTNSSPSPVYSSDTRNPSIGDITITGGTLIEVPEGYVIPDRSKGLRLVVTGTPIYL